MKNKLTDLNNHLFAALERLADITRAQGAVINKMGMGTVPAELKTAAVTMADISMKRRKLTTSKQEQAA